MIFNHKVRIFLMIVLGLTGCAYHSGRIHSAEESPDLSIQMFHNDTYQPGLEEKLTNLLIEEFLADGRVNIENQADADFLLSGRIHTYQKNILSLNSNDDVNLYQLVVGADVWILNTHSRQTVDSIRNLQSITTYVPLRNSVEFETEQEAERRLLEDLSNDIVYLVLDKNKGILNKK